MIPLFVVSALGAFLVALCNLPDLSRVRRLEFYGRDPWRRRRVYISLAGAVMCLTGGLWAAGAQHYSDMARQQAEKERNLALKEIAGQQFSPAERKRILAILEELAPGAPIDEAIRLLEQRVAKAELKARNAEQAATRNLYRPPKPSVASELRTIASLFRRRGVEVTVRWISDGDVRDKAVEDLKRLLGGAGLPISEVPNPYGPRETHISCNPADEDLCRRLASIVEGFVCFPVRLDHTRNQGNVRIRLAGTPSSWAECSPSS